jgi:Tol biopolymer transport system component
MAPAKEPNLRLRRRKVAMTENLNRPPAALDNQTPLESWKEIANYLNRTVRTVRRWEKEEKLPVRRHLHQAGSSVYAYPSELEAWKAARQPGFDQAPLVMPWRRPIPALGFALTLLLALVSVASGPILTPASAADGPDGMTVRRVWTGREVELLGSVSPDGRYMTSVDMRGSGNLIIRDIAAGTNRPLTGKTGWNTSSEYAFHSVFSPDGQRIAYAWYFQNLEKAEDGYQLRIIGVDGEQQRVLVPHDKGISYFEPVAWTPEGDAIVAHISRPDNTWALALVSVADGSVVVLRSFDWRRPLGASLSPSGEYLVYDFPQNETEKKRDISLLAMDGSREEILISHGANDQFPIWTPGGDRVLFISDRAGTPGLWMIPFAEGKQGGKPELVKSDVGMGRPQGFARGGSLYFGMSLGPDNIFGVSLAPQTGEMLGEPRPLADNFLGRNFSPAYSPDGNYLAYLSRRGYLAKILVIRNLETEEEREIRPEVRIANPMGNRRLRWSPDSRFILVTGKAPKGRRGIHRIEVETGKVTTLVRGNARYPELSPDGRLLYYWDYRQAEPGELPALFVKNLKDGTVREFHREPKPSVAQEIYLSPGGRYLAFHVGNPDQPPVIKVVLTAGGEAREILRNVDWLSVAWSHDGKHMLFLRYLKTGRELWRKPVDGGDPEKLGLILDDNRRISSLMVSPDGQSLVFDANKNRNEIWVMENFLPKTGTKAARLEE